jgi:hypothetical protein
VLDRAVADSHPHTHSNIGFSVRVISPQRESQGKRKMI